MMADVITALVVAAVVLRFATLLRAGYCLRAFLAMAAILGTLLPWPYGLAGWVQAHFGEFSITTGLLAAEALHHRVRGSRLLSDGQLRTGCMLVAALAVVFYPMSLGMTELDPYTFGYGDFLFSSVLLLLGLAAWVNRAWAPCAVLILAQFAFHFDLLSSNNLWDYLIDPALAVWAIGWLVRDRFASGTEAAQAEGAAA